MPMLLSARIDRDRCAAATMRTWRDRGPHDCGRGRWAIAESEPVTRDQHICAVPDVSSRVSDRPEVRVPALPRHPPAEAGAARRVARCCPGGTSC